MLVVATPSRIELVPYQTLESELLATVREINARYATDEWEPIVLVHENVQVELLAAIYRAADLCLVSSLQDGMNLVAKEFVASQVDEHGVLVLSRFTGAAEEIEHAVFINPFNVGGFADGIRAALEMDLGERRRRMRAMRAQLRRSTIFDWLESILARCAELMSGNGAVEPDVERQRPPAGIADSPAEPVPADANEPERWGDVHP
jgi:trehalose 6-phosphate synthase